MGSSYLVRIHTGDQLYAGTDSNIFLTMFGERGRTGEIRLNGYIKGNAFERNKWDTLTLDLPEGDIGDIYKIVVRSDGLYSGSTWLLDQIKIKNTDENRSEMYFYITQWLNEGSLESLSNNYHVKPLQPIIEEGVPFDGIIQKQHNSTSSPIKVTLSFSETKQCQYHIENSSIQSISLESKIGVQAGIFNAEITGRYATEIKTVTGYELNSGIKKDYTLDYTIPPNTKIDFIPHWVLKTVKFGAALGDTKFNIDVTSDIQYNGFSVIETNELGNIQKVQSYYKN